MNTVYIKKGERMSEQLKDGDSLPSASAEQEVMVLVKKMQQQLVSLEKKIDTLINKPQERPFRQNNFSKPFRSFGHHRRPEREHDNASGGKRFDRPHRFEKRHGSEKSGFGRKKEPYGSFQESDFIQEHPFEKRHGLGKSSFGHRKESYGNPRESGFTQERHFNKRHDSAKSGFDQKKKPFYLKRKDRK